MELDMFSGEWATLYSKEAKENMDKRIQRKCKK